MEAIKTAYNTAFSRLVLLAKSGKIGDVVSVDATCTSLKELAHLTDGAVLASRERDGKPEANGISSREGVFG